MRLSSGPLIAWALFIPAAGAMAGSAQDRATIRAVADDYYAAVLSEQPEQAYGAGVALERHDGLSDNSPAGLARWERREDAWLDRLRTVDANGLMGTPDWVTQGVLREQLEASVQMRVCKPAWWLGVNHMGSWHTGFATLAELQPVDTPEHRAQALVRWHKVAPFIRQEVANLRTGLDHGYSAARPVAERMLQQVDGLANALVDGHPYASPASRSTDEAFKTAYLATLRDEVLPALREYRTFLADVYVPRARTALAVTTLPDGAACYQALLRYNTTLQRTPAEVMSLGEQVVERNVHDAESLGKKLFGTADLAAAMRRIDEAPDNRFPDAAATLAASRELVTRAEAVMPRYFGQVPPQHVVVEPIPEYEDGAGASSHYEPPQPDGTPGTYRISLLRPGGTTRGEAEIVAFHETWPGHHLQLGYAQRVVGLHPVTRLLFNSGFAEGWARYAENLSEEAGLYHTEYAKVQRRAWPGRGMVVDPGIHAFGWSRDKAIAFIVASGRFNEKTASDAVDRIAAIPGQLTAYDVGAQEFFALRREAEAALGPRFDLKAFHDAALGQGTLTLPMLRAAMQRWIASQPR